MIKKITLLFALMAGTISYGQVTQVKGLNSDAMVCEAGGLGVIEYPNGLFADGEEGASGYAGESSTADWKWNQTVTDLAYVFFNGEAKFNSPYASSNTDLSAMISINNTSDFTLKAYQKRAGGDLDCSGPNPGNKVMRYSLELTNPFVSAGDVRTVTISVTDKNGVQENIVLTATYDPTASVDQLEQFNFSYAPNPTKDFIQLSAANPMQGVQIYNLLGQEVLQNTYNLRKAKVDVSDLNEGVYILKVVINDSIGTYKFIKE